MAFQFPASPTVSQIFEPVSGIQYRWSGEAWYLITHPQGGVAGPAGPPGQWTQVTQAQYDALTPPNPAILYVIIG